MFRNDLFKGKGILKHILASRRLRCLGAGLPLLFAALPACAAAPGAPVPTPCPPPLGDSAVTCYTGTDGNGSYYWIARPASWNGTLVVHAHGGPRTDTPSTAVSREDLERFAVTVQQGFAWAGSSYRRGGYGVRMAAEDSEAVRKIFIAAFGQPRRTIAHGQSWGGNVAAKLIELFPAGYDGALLTSGVLAGGTQGYDFRADLRAVYQYYCNNHPRPDEAQYPLWSGLPRDSRMTPKELAERVADCTGTAQSRTPEQQRRLTDIAKVIRIPESSLTGHMNWATFLFRDLVQERLDGRNPFSNAGVRYSSSHDDAALNAAVVRFRADPQAVARLAEDSDLTGKIAIPVVTLHAIDDPTAFVEHEAHYRRVVERAGHGNLLFQSYTREAVHSKLHTPQYPAVLDALMQWIDRGQAPSIEAVVASCEGYRKVYGERCAFDPAYRPAAFEARSYPRQP